jgi:hypothetical protein
MQGKTFRTGIDDELADALVTAARTSLGDTLRSVVYFTPSEFDVLYIRADLDDDPGAVRERKGKLVDFEVTGFAEAPVRTGVAAAASGPDIGAYEFTVRFHGNGFVARVIEGDAGALLTTDEMDVSAFEDAATAVGKLLAEAAGRA